jgi:TM2 domain-containing membrane protein YozV
MMKNFKLTALIVLGLGIFLSSCSIEKRAHMSGYHIDWNKGNKNVLNTEIARKAASAKIESLQVETSEEALLISENITASAEETAKPVVVAPKVNLKAKAVNAIEAAPVVANENTANKKATLKKSVEKENAVSTAAPKERTRNQIVAAVLCFFLGGLGIHRFYLGYTGIGIAQLLMFVLGVPLMAILIGIPIVLAAMIWVLIDFIRILLGNLKPKNGSYK